MDSITELAKLFKDRENPSMQGICVGKVLTPPPSLKITNRKWFYIGQIKPRSS